MSKITWTFENVKDKASVYKKISHFKKAYPGAYQAAQREGWLSDIRKHMETRRKWSFEQLQLVANEYEDYTEFKNKENGAYLYALKNGYLNKISSHMCRTINKKGYWNKERCESEAKKYSFRSDFMRLAGSTYNAALKNGWLDEICQHMSSTADGYKHCVYAILNDECRMSYIGITRQILSNRIKNHFKENQSSRSKLITGMKNTYYKQLTEYEFTAKEVTEAEKSWIDNYKANGWTVVNDVKQAGRVGHSIRKYSDEDILSEAKKYQTRSEFKRASPRIYDAAVSQRLLSRACKHMRSINQSGTWTKETCIDLARKCESETEFRSNKGAYDAALRNGWIEELRNYMRSSLTMPWLKKTANIGLWLDAQKIYDFWVEEGKCGAWKLEKFSGFRCDKLLKKFKSGWIPMKDEHWLTFCDQNH